MFPSLSSARIHLNSRCLSQAVFDSGSVDFDAEVIRPSLWSAAQRVPAPAGTCARAESGARQRSQGSSPSAGWMRCWSGGAADSAAVGGGLSRALLAARRCGLALASAADKERGSSAWQAASA